MVYIFLVIIGLVLSLMNFVKIPFLKWTYTLAVLITMVYLMGTVSPYHSFDTSAYMYMFNLPPSTHRFESGYMNLSYFFYVNGFSYGTFRICSYLLFVLVMFVGIYRLTPNLIGFYSLYLIFPFFLDVTQVRQFFMTALVIFGAGMLCSRKRSLRWLGVVSILISPLFQTSGFLYYLLLIMYKADYKKILKLMDYLIWILPILTLVIHYAHLNKIIANVLGFFLASRSNAIESINLYTQGSSFSVAILYIFSIMLCYFVFRKIIIVAYENSTAVRAILVNMFFIGVISIPLLASSNDFERFIRMSLLAFIITFSAYIYKVQKIGSHSWLKSWVGLFCIVALITTSWKYWDVSATGRNQYLPYIIKIKDPNKIN